MAGFIIVLVIAGVVVLVLATRKKDISKRSQKPPWQQAVHKADAAQSQPRPHGRFDSYARDHVPLAWKGKDEVLQIGGVQIRAPLTYVSSGHREAKDPSEINTTLTVRKAPHTDDLSYWPWYAHLRPEQRYEYLTWMAYGRSSLPPSDGYLFIYYYGLERRILVEQMDHLLVLGEIQRLRDVYVREGADRKSKSFLKYSASLLWYLAAVQPDSLSMNEIKLLASQTPYWSDDMLACALAWFARLQAPLPAWMAFTVAEASSHSKRSVVTKRVGDEFRTLFNKRYAEKYGKGLILRTAKRDCQVSYHPASSALSDVSASVPNAMGIPSQIKALAEIWNECVDDLRKLSSVVRDQHDGDERLTAAAWEAMPDELRASIDHPLTQPIWDLITEQTDEDGHIFVRSGDLGPILEIGKPAGYSPTQARRIATTVEAIGFALEPDARLTNKGYKVDELLAVFPLAYESEPDPVRYNGAACMLRLGLAIAEADGRIDAIELERITDHIERCFDLNDHEHRRLDALRTLVMQTGSDLTGLSAQLRGALDKKGRESVGLLLVAVAAADGVVTKGEQKALKRCYRLLGLTSETLDTALQDLGMQVPGAPVTVLPARPRRPGEPIPAPPSQDESIQLDHAAIARIMSETREVSSLLAQAMSTGEEEVAVAVAEPDTTSTDGSEPVTSADGMRAQVHAEPATPAFSGLDGSCGAFLQDLQQKCSWGREEADTLARHHEQMLSGAIERINEWAYDTLDCQLIYDDGDVIEVDVDVLKGDT